MKTVGCCRNPSGWADLLRRAALLVVGVVLGATTPSSSRLARLTIAPSAATGNQSPGAYSQETDIIGK